MKASITLLFLLVHWTIAQAQERFFEYMPGWRSNYAVELEDGYLLFGLGSNQPGHFYQYNEIDAQGTLVNEHTYAVDGASSTSAFKTSQRGVRIGEVVYTVGLFGNPAQGNIFYGGLFRYDIATGETELVKSYADNNFVKIDCIAQKNDTSLLLAGLSGNNFNFATLILRETDLEGNILWNYEGESCNGNCQYFAHTILPLSNGHSALLVNKFNANFPTFEDREKSLLIVVDQEGEELWRVEPGPHQDYKTLPGGLLEIDGSILLCYTDPYYYDNTGQWQINFESTIHLVSYSLDGVLLSETDLSGLIPNGNDPENPDAAHQITQLTQLDESHILLSGHTSNEGLLIKYALEGELVWIRHHHPHPLGIPNTSQRTHIYHTLQTSDGGFLCTGQYFTFPFELEPAGQQTAFALKVDQYGCLEEGCQGPLGTVEDIAGQAGLRLWPNPARDRLNVEVPTGVHPQTLDFIDATGRTVWSLAQPRTHHGPALQADLSHLPQGFYLLRLSTSEGDVYTGKLLKE